MVRAKAEKRESEQYRAFRKAARELGADESDDRFKDALRKIAKSKPSKQEKKRGSAA
jgi:hypothetical protein